MKAIYSALHRLHAPESKFGLARDAFPEIGRRIGALGAPALTVQEGGYGLETIGECVVPFPEGIEGGMAR